MFTKSLKLGKILKTFDKALEELDELQLQEEIKEADAMDEINKQQELLNIATQTKDRAGSIAQNFRNLLATENA